ncbi:uncharacterized protein SCHCODRAFT_02636442 [Schizophyllum commune H4-8]|uniref:uncharacterized protein n=1 Tax=Schizophyllum commune (strain H4-8 / FGSC 9210) TaxID=578458 RepID=UPI00216104EA|nr:uncharacterized protein SCHCODRAFT_02636442 [Schizophyllum commune H4-8]KAI5888334.1 hypothetical protein SCHCODRAFT_02636442 [Schizophyllum commune H4-8]
MGGKPGPVSTAPSSARALGATVHVENAQSPPPSPRSSRLAGLVVRRLANPVDGHARLVGPRLAGSLARVLISSGFARARLAGSCSCSSR